MVIQAVREHGSDVGMDQIAESAGTSKAVFYRYFADKADLYRRVGRKLAAGLVADIAAAVDAETDDRTMLKAGVTAYLRLLDEDPELYRFVVHNPVLSKTDTDAVADYTGMVGALITAIFDTRLEQLHLESATSAPWGAAVVGAVRAAGDWWLEHPGSTSRDDLAESLTTLVWGGISTVHRAAGRTVDSTAPEGMFRS